MLDYLHPQHILIGAVYFKRTFENVRRRGGRSSRLRDFEKKFVIYYYIKLEFAIENFKAKSEICKLIKVLIESWRSPVTCQYGNSFILHLCLSVSQLC